MAIYNGGETLEITDQDAWSRVECGMTIFMNIVLLRFSDKDWRECPVCRTRSYPRDNSGKLVVDWYVMMFLVANASTYLLIAVIVTSDWRVKMILTLALTTYRCFISTKGNLNLFVTSVFTNM